MAKRRIRLSPDTDLFKLKELYDLAVKLVETHGLAAKGWTVVYDNTKSRGGQCRYSQKEIGLSVHLFAIWEFDHCENTIIHEIAHALCPGEGHSKVWKAQFLALGGNGKRCWGSDGEARYEKTYRWIGTCPNGHEIKRQRKPRAINQLRSCAKCSSTFDMRFLITWSEVING